LFEVKVNRGQYVLTKGKIKRFKGVLGKRDNVKKAIVTLEKGQTIDIGAGA
jgi:large subunit ribosomal protein L23